MAIIKSAYAKDMASRAAPIELGDVRRKVRVEARPRARSRAVERRDVSRAVARGYREGFASGLRAGRRAAQQRDRSNVDALASALAAAVARWEADRSSEINGLRTDALALAIELARRIVGRTIEVDKRVVVDQLEAAMSMIGRGTSVDVRVHPDDRPILERMRLPAAVTLVADRTVGRGGCRLETAAGGVDATIETQFQRLVEAIAG